MTTPYEAAEAKAKFKVGDKVQKLSGYRFPGIVRSAYQKSDGVIRYDVEADHPDFAGMLHIFSESQLIPRMPLPTDPASVEGRDSTNPTASGEGAFCRTPGFASTADQSATALGRCDPAGGEGADMESSVQAGEKSTDAKLAMLRHSIGEGADKLFEEIGWHYQASSPEDTRQGISLIQNAFTARDAEIAMLRAELVQVNRQFDAVSEAFGWGAVKFAGRIDVEHAEAWGRQLQEGLYLQNSAAGILQPPNDLKPEQFLPWVKEEATKIEADRKTIAKLRAALENIYEIYEARSELFSNPTDLAKNLALRAFAAIKQTEGGTP